jgi:hypothetical protein
MHFIIGNLHTHTHTHTYTHTHLCCKIMDSGHPGYSQKSNEANEFPQGRERGSCLEDSPQYREKIAVNTPML